MLKQLTEVSMSEEIYSRANIRLKVWLLPILPNGFIKILRERLRKGDSPSRGLVELEYYVTDK